MRRYFEIYIAILLLLAGCRAEDLPDGDGVLYSCREFTLTADSLVERDGTVVRAPSSMHITSTYRRPELPPQSNEVRFRFFINGNLSEFSDPHLQHRLRLDGSRTLDTLVMTHGLVDADENMRFAAADSGSLDFNTPFTFRVDMRQVLKQMGKHKWYIRRGDTIVAQKDFRGVWLRGNNVAISADEERPEDFALLQMRDRGDSVYELAVRLNPAVSEPRGGRDRIMRNLPARYPRATVGMNLPDALWNMAVSTLASEPEAPLSPLAVGLSLAIVDPERSMASLRSMVKGGRIASDATSAWPVSAERVAWIEAAYEVYCATGDSLWRREMLEVAHNTLADDMHVSYNGNTGLFCGSAVPLTDVAEYYPPWMTMADIYASMSSLINALYCRAFAVLNELQEGEADRYGRISKELAHTINLRLWEPQSSLYSLMLAGTPYRLQTPTADNRGQALCILYNVAEEEMCSRILRRTPVTHYGVTRLVPYTSTSPGVFNGVVDPATNALWCMAAAKGGDAEMVSLALASLMRGAALACAEPPGVDAFTGHLLPYDPGPQERIESAAARIAATLRVLAGMRLTPNGIKFAPVIPLQYAGEKLITGLHYRDTELSVLIHGTGRRVARFTVDGELYPSCTFPANLKGHHDVEIVMAGNNFDRYGPRLLQPKDTVVIPVGSELSAYRPLLSVAADTAAQGEGVMLSAMVNTHFSLEAEVPEAGRYLVRVVYDGLPGPRAYQSACAIRTLLVNGTRAGTAVMPVTGVGTADTPSTSNFIEASLEKGLNEIAIDYVVPYDINAASTAAEVRVLGLDLYSLP